MTNRSRLPIYSLLWGGAALLILMALAVGAIGVQQVAALSANAISEAAAQQARYAQQLMIGLTVGLIAFSVLLAILLPRMLNRALGASPAEIRERVREIGANNLRSDAAPSNLQGVAAELNAMTHSLAATVNQVRQASFDVETESNVVANTSEELLARVEQQASMLSETASAMEQLGGTVANNAERAQEVGRDASEAARLAGESGDLVVKVERTIQDLNARSEEVVSIVSLIDNIAFQTNILALNASVEAARAGEQGRGFAVVAQEVRQLATRSAEASQQISHLIHTNIEQVASSAALTSQADDKTRQAVQAITRVTELVSEISQASTEQTQAVQEVAKAVSEMDAVTQQNAQLVRQNAEAGDGLSKRSNQLGDAIAKFDLDDEILLPRARTTQEASKGQLPTGMLQPG